MEVIGYVGRAFASGQTDQLMPYILQSLFLLLPPVLFAASVYMVLSRIICAAHGEQYSLVRLTIITKLFVWSDVVSFLVQSTGAGMMATGNSMASMGQKIVIGGLFIQIIMFSFFGIIADCLPRSVQSLQCMCGSGSWVPMETKPMDALCGQHTDNDQKHFSSVRIRPGREWVSNSPRMDSLCVRFHAHASGYGRLRTMVSRRPPELYIRPDTCWLHGAATILS